MPRCAGIKRDGGRCAVVVGPGQSHCYAHDPDRADERRRNASRGGRMKGAGEISDLKKQLANLAADVLSGEVEREIKETEELEARLEALEAVLKARRTA